MKRKRVLKHLNNAFIKCCECNYYKPNSDYYVMKKMGGAFDRLFLTDKFHKEEYAVCDECCGNEFSKRVKEFLKKGL